MNVYVDTSVLLRIVFGERGALRQWQSIDVAVSSELIRVEALRTIDRARVAASLSEVDVSERRAAVLEILGGFHLARIDPSVLERAADPFPTSLRTLDAIHLATALLARQQHTDLIFATHDAELARAARAVGLHAIGSP